MDETRRAFSRGKNGEELNLNDCLYIANSFTLLGKSWPFYFSLSLFEIKCVYLRSKRVRGWKTWMEVHLDYCEFVRSKKIENLIFLIFLNCKNIIFQSPQNNSILLIKTNFLSKIKQFWIFWVDEFRKFLKSLCIWHKISLSVSKIVCFQAKHAQQWLNSRWKL